eukprot:6202032-Amphidinium_carterae.1
MHILPASIDLVFERVSYDELWVMQMTTPCVNHSGKVTIHAASCHKYGHQKSSLTPNKVSLKREKKTDGMNTYTVWKIALVNQVILDLRMLGQPQPPRHFLSDGLHLSEATCLMLPYGSSKLKKKAQAVTPQEADQSTRYHTVTEVLLEHPFFKGWIHNMFSLEHHRVQLCAVCNCVRLFLKAMTGVRCV